jgi:site-specific DNA-methyltransferase (adenine-specific)
MIEILNMDCMDYMRDIPDNYFDLAVVDPPYGINVNKMNMGSRKTVKPTSKKWDESIPQQEYFDLLKKISRDQVIWGGELFPSATNALFFSVG